MSTKPSFHHALHIDEQLCNACTHCVKVCPTEAIRVHNGVAEIYKNRCIDCGDCMRACPKDAISIEHDDLEQIKNYRYRVALFPAVFIGQFPERIKENQIYNALLKIGFTHVYEVEQHVEILQDEIKKYIKQYSDVKPIISSFCPGIMRLISIKYPSLTDHIVRVKAPHDLAAHYVLHQFTCKEIDHSEVGLFYVTPCAAKIAAVKSPIGEEKSIIDGVINMNELYNQVMAIADKMPNEGTEEFRSGVSKEGIQWSLTHGETTNIPGRSVAVDGVHNAVRFLERLENEEVPDIDFLELRACDQSCAGGILLAQNRFLTVERLKQRSRRYPSIEKIKYRSNDCNKEDLIEKMKIKDIESLPMNKFGDDVALAIERMQKARRIMCHLPGIDCGACGAPSCMALAEDMVNHNAKMTDCIFIQQLWQRNGKITSEKAFDNLENRWGKNRLDPDCTKKGAKNEGF